MRIIFVRHGEPDYEHDCLTENGVRQADLAAKRLKDEGIEEIYCSPLGRAVQTAQPASKELGLPVKTLDFMREVHWGSTDGSLLFLNGHPWNLTDELIRRGWDLNDPAWRQHEFYRNNIVTAEVDKIAERTDEWLFSLGYERCGLYYRCVRENDEQHTVALFSHGGSSSAAMGHILNLQFPYACALFHIEFTGITILRFDRHPGSVALPCMELANDGRHIRENNYRRLMDM